MRILILISLALTASILNSQDYFSDRLFVKLKEEYKTTYVLEKDKSLRILLSPAELVSAKPVSAHPFLNSTYELIFDKNINLDSLILRLNRFPEIEFAEKVPLYKLFFTPNDPLYSTQWNLSKIQADLAWNLSQGCTQVKVAVTDDGFLMTHEDLVNQWHINTGEIAGNGIDDDGNGYIDDWRGWDAANNDNDPSATAPTNSFFTHGTHVAGIIAGQTHNSKGIAAIGYNCKMIPVKIGLSPNSSLTGAFQGLDYAIKASGCDVVNMSWGGGGWSATYQTLFNIAQAKGIICVAAAGNSNTSTPMYPASYNHVISVAASASTDARASFSNFGSTIDVTAPGVGIPSCLAGATNAYGNLSGTSMASPLVAGLCALMKCYNPMPADSIEACLKRTCDNINAQNPSFIGQLGAGRINAFQALQCLTKKPKSDFIALDTFQCTGKSVRYAARSFGIPTLSYNWSFPGGSPASSTTANPVVSYTTNGYKTATLITCNSLGCDTITKTNLVYIDTPKASLIGRKYTSYNSNQVLITIKFTGNPPYSVTLTDGTNTWTQSNVKANPYFLSIVPKKDTSLISISAFSDSLCVGNKYGADTIHRTNLGKDTTICVVLKTSNTGAIDGFGLSPTTSTNITWTFTNNENVVANWTAGGVPHFWRNILKFNLAGIPANAIINSASLSLYSKPNASHGWTGQPTAGTDNSTSISRITNAWTTSSISTSSWPSITTQNQVILAQSPSNNHSYLNIDVKNLVQDLITTNDFGLFLRHINTPYYNSLIYYSAEETDTSKHPKLVLCYTIPGGGSSSGGGNPQYCESSFKFNGTPTNTVVKIDPKNGAAWKDLYSTNGFTWECWFNLGNRTTVTGMESVVTASDAQLCEDIGFIFNMPWSGGTGFGWVVSGQTGCGAPKGVIATSMSFSPNTWYHAAGVMDYSTSTMRLYINGNQVNSGTLTIPMSQRMKNSVAVTIGNQDVNYNPYHTFTPFNGKIDEVRFWNTVRTASEIQANYKACLAANTSNLIAYFKADEGTGNNTVSVINGNFVGTLQNSASWDTQVDSVKNCTLCSNSLCRDSTEINSAQTGWQALQANGSWGSLTSCNYVTSLFTANAANFPGMTVGNCLWGPIVSNPSRTYYNSSSQTTTTTANADIAVFRKEITIPADAIIDSVRLWMLSDDFVDSVLINSKNIYNTPIPITYGQVLYTKKDINVGSAVATNYVIIKAGDLGGNYGHYFRMKVYYSKVCGNSTSDCDTSGLVLCMSMDGNANDSTKFAHNGIVRGATLTTGRNGISNSAYYFDGTTSHISLGVKPMLKPNAASISVWVKPHTFNSYTGGNANCIFLTKNPNNPGSYMEAYSLYLTNRSGPTKFMTVSTHQPTTNEKWFQSVQNTNLNQWTHLVLTFDFDSLRLYINGQLDNKTYKGFNNVYDALDSIMIGYSANTMNKNYFKGDMDELKIYNRVLSNTEILNLYNKPFTCSCIAVKAPSDCDTTNLNTGKVLHLDFNGNTQDKSGNGNHAANFGATPVAGKGGVVNTAYKFNGTSNYMRVSNNATINSMTQITMCAILKPKGFYNGPCMNNQIISKNNINNSGHYSLVYSPLNDNGACSALQDSNKCNFYSGISSGGCSVSTVYKAPFIKKDSWYCVVTTYDGDTAKNYVNGELRFTCKINLPLGSNSADLFIGKLDNITFPYWLNADVDDIRIYNRALAPSEVKGYCGTCNVTPPSDCDTADLLACYPFSGNVNDSIGNNHGTVNGANLVTDRYGNSNSAYNFDGVNDDIQINATLGNFNTSDYTISFWMKMNNNDNSIYRFIEKRNICNFHNFWGINITNGQLQLEIDQSNSSNYLTIISKTKINDGNWHQVSFVRKGNDLNVFIDGKFDTVKLGSMIINSDNSFVLKFGTGVCVGLDGTKFFLGQLDDIKIYKRALNTSEVSYLYAKPFTCSCNAVQPPPCDTSRRFTFTQCLNDSIQVIARAGSKYQWSPVSGLSNDTIRNPNVFVSNNQRYLVSYTSLKNCQLIDTIDVDVKAAAIYPKMEDQIICIGDSVQMTIPISATNIVWSPNAAISSTSSKNPYFFPTSPSTYYLEFRDTFGCLHRDTFVVNTKACCPARARFTIPKDLLCFGETLPVSNTSKGPITSYSWNFGSAIPNTFSSANPPILTFPSGGSYTLRLIVTNGSCQDTMEKTITVVQIMPNAGKDTFNCLGAFTVQLGESAISDWSYSWTPSKFLNDPNIANPICNIVNDSVNYILEITDRSSGCMAYDTVVVYTNRNIVSKTTKQRICSGDSVLFNNNYSKTTNLYYYTIKKTDGICDSFIDILDLNVLQKQVLTYTPKIHCEFYIDGKGKRHDTSYIEQDTIRSKSLLNCDSIINITPREIFKKTYTEKTVQGCSPFLYNGKTYITSKVKEDSIRIRGAYSGCDSIIEYINVIVYPKPKAEISPSIPNPVLYKQTVTLTASGGSGYLWLQMGSTNSEIDYKLNQIQPRLFTVRVTDDNNCWDTVSYIVNGELPDTCYYGFPNAFTPNQDGLNDEYIPNMDECTEIKVFAIYDRWGEKVFETNQQKGWNGFYKGKPAPLSVYLYYAELITPWGIKIHKGNFTLIR